MADRQGAIGMSATSPPSPQSRPSRNPHLAPFARPREARLARKPTGGYQVGERTGGYRPDVVVPGALLPSRERKGSFRCSEAGGLLPGELGAGTLQERLELVVSRQRAENTVRSSVTRSSFLVIISTPDFLR